MKTLLNPSTTVLLLLLVVGRVASAQVINQGSPSYRIVNNHSFPVRMPVVIERNQVGDGWRTSEGNPVQREGGRLHFIANVSASSTQNIVLTRGAGSIDRALVLKPSANGIDIIFAGIQIGSLSWQILYRDAKPEELKGVPVSTREDFSASFQPAAIAFERTATGPVFDTWRGVAESRGLSLTIDLRTYHEGFLDIESTLENVSAEKVRNVYAAVLTRWQQGAVRERAVCYDNRIKPFGEYEWTNFREGESRNWYVQHGVDWIRTNFDKSISVGWLNDFSQSFTVHQNPTAKRRGRWIGANIPQIGFEAETSRGDLYLLTEIARSNLKSYAERLESNRLMDRGERIQFSSRLVFFQGQTTDEQVDNAFVGYTSYARQSGVGDHVQYSIGVPYTRFGTNYFPYSTLGENFDVKKLPGMDRDGYWPLAADTVNQWQLFADDIRRDLRIAKTLGFELIRLHHLELLDGVAEPKRREYLDFLFREIKGLQLKVLIDTRMSPEETAEITKRYRDVIDGVEIDNEVLIFGINDDAPDYWKRTYAAVKEVAPEIPVHLTAHTNAGIFDRLQELSVPFDKVGQHAYSDGLDSIPNTRGFALAAASYGRRMQKEPVITEWNWRFLTRMTPEDRAKAYAPIFENVLRTRSIPEMFQFQFNESLAMNPRILKGIRHYEPIWLSRRPKPEAYVLSGLIKKYAAPDHPNRLIDVDHPIVELDATGRGITRFRISNTGGRELTLKTAVEPPGNIKINSQASTALLLKPNESKIVSVELQALPTDGSPRPLPGFYHVFLRIEGDGILRYGWAEARFAGEPKFDKETKTAAVFDQNVFSFSLDRPLAVVYGDRSPVQDVETAYAVVNALESATGRPVKIFELKDLPRTEEHTLILVGTSETNQLIRVIHEKIPANIRTAQQFAARVSDDSNKDWLVLSGANSTEAERAAMDWIIRFWKYAKDSAARRVGLVEKELPVGVDQQALP